MSREVANSAYTRSSPHPGDEIVSPEESKLPKNGVAHRVGTRLTRFFSSPTAAMHVLFQH